MGNCVAAGWAKRSRRASLALGLLCGAAIVLLATRGARAQPVRQPPANRTQSKTTGSHEQPSQGRCCIVSPAEAAWSMLAEDIRSRNRLRRSNAIAALAIIGPRHDVLPLLEGALRDKDAGVRKDAATALGAMPAPSTKESLRACLRDENPEVAFGAADALWKMGDRSGRDIFLNTLDGTAKRDSGVKDSISSNVEKYSNPKRLALTGAKEAAGAFLGPLPVGLEIAHELLKDRTASARAASAQLLGKDSSPEAVEKLTQARFDKNWAVRAAAAQALAVSPGKVSVEVLQPMLEDDNAAVRDIAAAGIIRRSQALRPSQLRWPLEETQATREAKR